MFTNSKLHDTIEHDTIARKPSQPINKSITHQNINNVANKVQQPTPLIDISVPPPLYNPVWHQFRSDLVRRHIKNLSWMDHKKGKKTIKQLSDEVAELTNIVKVLQHELEQLKTKYVSGHDKSMERAPSEKNYMS